MVIHFTTKYKEQIINDAKKEFRSKSNFTKKIIMDNIYNFNDSEIKGGKKPKVKHNVKVETAILTDNEYEQVSKIAKHYNITPTKLVAFIINQYYEEKENE